MLTCASLPTWTMSSSGENVMLVAPNVHVPESHDPPEQAR
jgi:hypothetical protein